METRRHIGIDLHRNCFTACVRLENGRNYVTEWKLEQLPKFVAKLRPSDEVEVTGNTRLFHDAVAPHVKRAVAVNPNQGSGRGRAKLRSSRLRRPDRRRSRGSDGCVVDAAVEAR
jgi:hypothetical protein